MDLFSDGGVIQAVSRWLHIIAGITWIGLLYFFNLSMVTLPQHMMLIQKRR